MIERRIKQHVTAALDRQAAVALIGPRQVGKTTLAQGIAEERDALYLDILSVASVDLLRQSGESLAGRIEYVDMQPLDVTKVAA